MRRPLPLLFVVFSLASSGCEWLMDFFNIPSDSNAANQRQIYKPKTGHYPN
ncbi:MAG TPA: hypothetical protein VG826_09240 [Pirellulales bacterium]|nr:hypothetical protein [Pirellulales bacterium]